MSGRRGATWLLLAWLVTGQGTGCHRRDAQDATIEPGRLVRQGWNAVDREDAAAAREAIRRLRAMGQADLAAVLQARLPTLPLPMPQLHPHGSEPALRAPLRQRCPAPEPWAGRNVTRLAPTA